MLQINLTYYKKYGTIMPVINKQKKDWSGSVELVKKLIKFTIALTISILGTVIIVNADPGVVTGNGVNFRSGPGTGYNIYACLPRGTYVTVD